MTGQDILNDFPSELGGHRLVLLPWLDRKGWTLQYTDDNRHILWQYGFVGSLTGENLLGALVSLSDYVQADTTGAIATMTGKDRHSEPLSLLAELRARYGADKINKFKTNIIF